ncbi:MAG TPA: hypothetical protein VN025_08820 [Candidatus Dormibacteraeota bacterium]|jgi:hypothetical protein|nr:hypothetical protein [Candidatus Dormibacteraeota bacterium]
MTDKPHRSTFKIIVWLVLTSLIASALAFFCVGIRSFRRAQHLRSEISALQIEKSTFADLSAISAKYDGNVLSHDDVPKSCSPEGCSYLLSVQNPVSKLIPIWPQTAFLAKVRISDNVLKERYVCIAQMHANRYIEVFVQQSADSKLREGSRIIRESKVPRMGIQVSPHDSAQFTQLANRLKLNCLILLGTCSQPKDMLPDVEGAASKENPEPQIDSAKD